MRPDPPRYLLTVALLAPFLVAGALSLVRDDIRNVNGALLLVLVVVGVAAFGRRGTGVIASVSSALWFDFFLTEPYERFSIRDRDDLETAVLLVLVGLAVTEIALWGRRQQARASRRQGYLDGVVGAASMVAADDARPAAVTAYVSRQVIELLGVEECRYVASSPSGAHPRLLADGRVVRDGRPIDVDRSGLPTDDVIVLPVETGGRAYGHFELVASARTVWTDREQRRVAVVLAEQVAHVIATRGESTGGPASGRPR